MSKVLYVLSIWILVALHIKAGEGIDCLQCSWTPTSGVPACFNITIDPTAIPSLSCPYKETDNPYCQTVFTYEDGIVSSIVRKCQAGMYDEDVNTNEVPRDDLCEATYSPTTSSNVATVKCYLSCWNPSCNTKTPAELELCSENCGLHGSCDYITGICTCEDGWSGSSCSIQSPPLNQTFQSCVQCDSESNPNCDQLRTATLCANPTLKYCAVTTTTTFATDGSIKGNFISRSCTANFQAADECFISSPTGNPNSKDLEYTCVSTCDTPECNIGRPNGIVDKEDTNYPIQCVVCDSNNPLSNCQNAVATTPCASTDSSCTSTVTYYLSEKTDVHYYSEPDYRLERIVRNCSASPVMAKCTSEFIHSSSLQKVTCQETCQDDGCNTGWPARPQCSQCACTNCASDDSCSISPPAPSSCAMPYHEYCVIRDNNRPIIGNGAQYGYPRDLARSCSHLNISNSCSRSKYSFNLESCNTTCSTYGCNLGYYANLLSGSSRNRFSILGFLTSCMLALLFAAKV